MYSKIKERYDHYAEKEHFSGAGFVKCQDTVVFSAAYGDAHKGFKVPNTVETAFDTASITKLFTAVAILQLVERGLLNLDDRITALIDLSGTCIPGDVTIRHLMTHTSGIADDADEEAGENYEDLFIDKPNYTIRTCRDFIPQFAYKAPVFKAGTNVRYNNCAFVLLGLAIEEKTGMRYQDYVTEQVFRKCGMHHTSFASKDDSSAAVAEGYFPVCDDQGNVTEWRKNIYSFPPIGTADGGAFTSVVDLDRFMRALVNGTLLSTAMTSEIMKPQTTIEQTHPWGKIVNGFGFHFKYPANGDLPSMYKEGSNAGVAAMFAYYPTIGTTSIVLANQTCYVWKLHQEIEEIQNTITDKTLNMEKP